jgi:hypothetical protein
LKPSLATLKILVSKCLSQSLLVYTFMKSIDLTLVRILFANTKLTENITQQIVSGDLAGDLTQVVQGIADVQRQKIVGDLVIEAFTYGIYSFPGLHQVVVVADIGDNGIAGFKMLKLHHFGDAFFEIFDICFLSGRDQHHVRELFSDPFSHLPNSNNFCFCSVREGKYL